jgi:hypothetical protein
MVRKLRGGHGAIYLDRHCGGLKKGKYPSRKKTQKLTAQPHARAGSMEVDGYENPC